MRTEGQLEILRTRFKTEVTNTLTPFLLDINGIHSTLVQGRKSVVGILPGVGAGQPKNRCVDSCQWKHIFLLSIASKSALQSTQPSIHWALEAAGHVGKSHGK